MTNMWRHSQLINGMTPLFVAVTHRVEKSMCP